MAVSKYRFEKVVVTMGRTDGKLHFGLTDAGKVILRGTAFIALAALIVPAFGILTALVSIILTALIVGFFLRPKIQISGNLPERIIVGQIAQLRYELKNVTRLPAYNVCVRFGTLPETIEQVEGEHMISRLGPGESTEITIVIKPRKRGFYSIRQPICQSSFPFNLFSFGVFYDDEETLIVLPAFSLLQVPLGGLSRRVRTDCARLAGRIGVSPEYVGNRPFLPGDSPRRIDARAWARLSVPATKEYDDDFDNYTALILDTAVPKVLSLSKSYESQELEAAVSLCASLAFTINNYCIIDFLLVGPALHQFTTWPRVMCLDKIHEILAGVEPSSPDVLRDCLEHVEPILADHFCKVSEVVFILLSLDKTYRQLLELADQAGCHSSVILIGESGEIHVDEGNVRWTGNIQLLSANEILTGQIKRI